VRLVLSFILAVIAFIVLAISIWFGYFYSPFGKSAKATRCGEPDAKFDNIPAGSVAFALAFENLGEANGTIKPGDANQCLADWLENHAARFSLVLTQKAISDALENPQALQDGTPVLQMHRHVPGITVRTLETLRCALDRFDTLPDSIVLVAHDKHYERAANDLRSMCPQCSIVNPYIADVPYKDDSPLNPLRWALREMFARPADCIQRRWCTVSCRGKVRLEQIEMPIENESFGEP
jgi:hypothetical protein